MKATLQSINRLSNGNYNVTAALTAPIGNIKRIRATIVSTYQQFSSASGGTSEPVGSTIAAAPSQNGFLSFLPLFSRQVTWTHPTTGGAGEQYEFRVRAGIAAASRAAIARIRSTSASDGSSRLQTAGRARS